VTDGRRGSSDLSPRQSFARYLLLDADRGAVAAVIWLASFAVVLGLGWADVIGADRSGPVSALLRATVSGLFTLVTVVITINQLILSRVLGSPGELEREMERSTGFRDRVADRANVREMPTDPGAFLRLVAESARDRCDDLRRAAATEADGDAVAEVERYLARVDPLVEDVLDGLDDGMAETYGILRVVLLDDFSDTISVGRRIARTHEDALSSETTDALAGVVDLLETISIVRQYLKTLYIQQALSRVSGLVLYLGFPALVLLSVTLLAYARTGGTVLTGDALMLLVTAALTAAFAPLAVLLSYVSRLAAIARLTTSVGPFKPQEESVG
jgi:hypothetical protein